MALHYFEIMTEAYDDLSELSKNFCGHEISLSKKCNIFCNFIKFILPTSVADPGRFFLDPDPRIRF